jgi:hypothetical protein
MAQTVISVIAANGKIGIYKVQFHPERSGLSIVFPIFQLAGTWPGPDSVKEIASI